MLAAKPATQNLTIRLANTPEEIEAAQHLRYKVFYEEFFATADRKMAAERLDIDAYDEYAHHLIVIDHSDNRKKIVGTYRLLLREHAERYGRFYSSNEFDISPLLNSGVKVLELGRSCVLPEYRSGTVMQMLWQGISDFVTKNGIGIMFGCASLPGTNITNIAKPLSYLYHYHLTTPDMPVRAVKGRYINMNIVPKEDIEAKAVFSELPPLIKGYLRVGATIGDGAVVDADFNTTDVCIIVRTERMTRRYRAHFERQSLKNAKKGKNVEDMKSWKERNEVL
ncbi:MAG: GNAT family N-acetyltransferase [Alphaproteobacteria bacterium]